MIKLTGSDGMFIWFNVHNIVAVTKESDENHSRIYVVGDDEYFLVIEAPADIITLARLGV